MSDAPATSNDVPWRGLAPEGGTRLLASLSLLLSGAVALESAAEED